jgi:hypothetical protein
VAGGVLDVLDAQRLAEHDGAKQGSARRGRRELLPVTPTPARDGSTPAVRIPAMAHATDSGIPSFKEALKNDREQFDDCTPCRIVGESAQLLPLAIRTMANACGRQRGVPRPRRVHVRVRTLAAEGTGSSHKAEQEHLRHGEPEGRHHRHGNRTGRGGRVQVVQLDTRVQSQVRSGQDKIPHVKEPRKQTGPSSGLGETRNADTL